MANELTVTAGVNYSNGGVALAKTANDQVTVSANYLTHSIHTVTTSGEALPLGGVSVPGYCWVQNRDSSNFIQIGNSGDAPVVRVGPGEVAVFRFSPSITPWAIADTGNCVIELIMISD